MLFPPDTHHFSAAVGWLELGNAVEARAELARISPEHKDTIEVLELTWGILAHEKNWSEALKVAREIIQSWPDNVAGWLHQAYALRRVSGGGLQAAWDALFPVAEKFGDEAVIPFNLSCYACQLSRLDEARRWLRQSMKIGGWATIKKMALNDPDLESLWPEIRRWSQDEIV